MPYLKLRTPTRDRQTALLPEEAYLLATSVGDSDGTGELLKTRLPWTVEAARNIAIEERAAVVKKAGVYRVAVTLKYLTFDTNPRTIATIRRLDGTTVFTWTAPQLGGVGENYLSTFVSLTKGDGVYAQVEQWGVGGAGTETVGPLRLEMQWAARRLTE